MLCHFVDNHRQQTMRTANQDNRKNFKILFMQVSLVCLKNSIMLSYSYLLCSFSVLLLPLYCCNHFAKQFVTIVCQPKKVERQFHRARVSIWMKPNQINIQAYTQAINIVKQNKTTKNRNWRRKSETAKSIKRENKTEKWIQFKSILK